MSRRSSRLPGSIRERRPGVWEVTVSLGRDASGKYPRKTTTVYGDRDDAIAEQLAMAQKLHRGQVLHGPITLRLLLEDWLAGLSPATHSPTTIERYRGIIEQILIPALGAMRADQMRAAALRRFYSAKLEQGLAPATVRKYHNVLFSVLSQAVADGLIEENVAARITDPPRPQPPEMHVLSELETAALLKRIAAGEADAERRRRLGCPLYVLVLVAVTTGMRRGELLGLKWDDVEFDRAMLHVRRSLRQTPAGLELGPPKTPKSRRPIPLHAGTVEALAAHRAQQAALRLRLGAKWHDEGLVFPQTEPRGRQPGGRKWAPDALEHAFRRRLLAERDREQQELQARGATPTELAAALAKYAIRFHELRHTHATHLLRAGVHPKVVSERLGHASVQITLDLYSHVLPDTQAAAVEALNGLL